MKLMPLCMPIHMRSYGSRVRSIVPTSSQNLRLSCSLAEAISCVEPSNKSGNSSIIPHCPPLCVDLGGFCGLMGFSVALGLISLGSVLSMRIHEHDLIA